MIDLRNITSQFFIKQNVQTLQTDKNARRLFR